MERSDATTSPDAPARIVRAGVRCVTREGVSGASMAAIAVEAGVSKALLHYHYHDRATLLAEIAERIGIDVVERERAAVDEHEGTGGLDALWGWLADELRRGELAALAMLSLIFFFKVRLATRSAATASAKRGIDDQSAAYRAGSDAADSGCLVSRCNGGLRGRSCARRRERCDARSPGQLRHLLARTPRPDRVTKPCCLPPAGGRRLACTGCVHRARSS